ncbi:MAG: LDH2 family malate/lactate/ureidoglycolate dehydrogenase [Moritella sp.]|jgi:LDH2 family malate/lactate/ureidoglycolate dehydrogenase
MITVSHNELVVLCAKAFNGLQRNCGEADMIANMVADLEMVGLNGIEHFVNALAFLQYESDNPITVTHPSAVQVTTDLHDGSILCHLPGLLDYSIEKLISQEQVTLHITHCHNRWLAFGELIKLAGKGLSVQAQWSNGRGSKQKHVVYILNAGCILPELYISEKSTRDQHSLSIAISKKNIALPNAGQETTHLSSAILKQAKQHAWQEGITVNATDWKKIKQAAGAILVENSEKSERGAGEVKSTI